MLRSARALPGRQAHEALTRVHPEFVWSTSWLGTFDALAERALDRFDKTVHVEETRYEPERGLFEWTARVRLKTEPPPFQHTFTS